MKKHLYIIFALAIALSSCSRNGASLDGQFIGAVVRPVFLEMVTPGVSARVDSTMTDEAGRFRFKIAVPDGEPTIFNLRYDGEMVPLLVSPGERVSVMSFGDIGRGYSVSGSAESELVAGVHRILSEGAASLDSISGLWAMGNPGEERMTELTRAYFDEYYRIKREQIKFIVANSSSLAAVYALYQRLPGDEVLFNGDTDFVYYQMVADSVQGHYPDSRYLLALEREIETGRARRDFDSRVIAQNVRESDYPDIELPNMYGQKVRLSSLAGQVILLDFWSAGITASRINNAELKELWDEYADRGLAIYQVSLDTSKPLWVNAVQEQKLPWISVCDFRGEGSPGARLYNVTSLPTDFIIARDGTIVGKDLYGEELVAKIEELL